MTSLSLLAGTTVHTVFSVSLTPQSPLHPGYFQPLPHHHYAAASSTSSQPITEDEPEHKIVLQTTLPNMDVVKTVP